MKRHAALIPFSHDHQHGLAASLRLSRAVAHLQQTDEDEPLLLECESFLRFARTELASHFAEEEHALAPLLLEHPDELGRAVDRMLREHALIRRTIRRLAHEYRRDLGTSSIELAQHAAQAAELLRRHIRWEERELFERLQEIVQPAELDRLGVGNRNDVNWPEGVQSLDLRVAQHPHGLAAELNVTAVDLAPGEHRPAWSAEREVALVLVRGEITVTVDEVTNVCGTPYVLIIPAGMRRTFTAGQRGASLLSIHRERGPLQVTTLASLGHANSPEGAAGE